MFGAMKPLRAWGLVWAAFAAGCSAKEPDTRPPPPECRLQGNACEAVDPARTTCCHYSLTTYDEERDCVDNSPIEEVALRCRARPADDLCVALTAVSCVVGTFEDGRRRVLVSSTSYGAPGFTRCPDELYQRAVRGARSCP